MQIAFMFIGKAICESKFKKDQLYKDMEREFEKTFSHTLMFEEENLKYMEKFYELYKPAIINNELTRENILLFATEYFAFISWSYQKVIIDASDGDFNKAKEIMNKIIGNDWSLGNLKKYVSKETKGKHK